MTIPILRGRGITPDDRTTTEPVAIVSEKFAAAAWPGQDAIGKRFKTAILAAPWTRVVGIAADVSDASLATPPSPHIYVSILQEPDSQLEDRNNNQLRSLMFAVKMQGDSNSLTAAIVEKLHTLNPSVAIGAVREMQHELDLSVAPQRFNAALVAIYATVALLLSLIGIYGVLAYTVTQQTHDIGVRMALGARRINILGLVLRRGLALAAIGSIVGLAGAFAVTRLMSALLYGVQPHDPVTFASVTLLFVAASVAACLIPARRAMRVDPVIALRHE